MTKFVLFLLAHCFKQRCNNSIMVNYKKFYSKDTALTQVLRKTISISGQFSYRDEDKTKTTNATSFKMKKPTSKPSFSSRKTLKNHCHLILVAPVTVIIQVGNKSQLFKSIVDNFSWFWLIFSEHSCLWYPPIILFWK